MSCNCLVKTKVAVLSMMGLLVACGEVELPVAESGSDLHFDRLATSWDEGIPLGNATVGSLVWQRDSALRFSLDRTDLWDLRPMDSLAGDRYRFAWVQEQVRKNDYLPVQKKFDWPYDREAAPAKIPGAALEFSLEKIGTPTDVRLFLNDALCEVSWANGVRLQTFVHATEPVGWFLFDHLTDTVVPTLQVPSYGKGNNQQDDGPVGGLSLLRLGYEQGTIDREGNSLTYHQEGWGDYSYDVNVRWQQKGDRLYGVWSITSSLVDEKAGDETQEAMTRGIGKDFRTHKDYWDGYWAQSSVTLPDPVLQKQYDNEMYKFGSATREDSYPISLQAVWTADNGKLPPWKGDYHHDLNTQLSYWPAYTGNRLKEGMGYLNTLWKQRDVYKKYTRQYFETEGMNVPGVCTLTGEPLGGWIQYSMSQTAGAWLAQHFYLHWKYSADPDFLKDRAYPFLKDVAVFLEQISVVDEQGVRRLAMSSSPEVFDNSIRAWFKDMTNYDLALMRFAFRGAAEMADSLGLASEAQHWQGLEAQLPPFDLDDEGCLTFAKGFPYDASHRHFSHALAIHPLGLIDYAQGEESKRVIDATLKRLDLCGPDWWTGYSYSWFGNMKARAFDGEGAAAALRTFAECFCLPNTFHVNGDQSQSGKSKFTYRPFTLEGNFAFASGIQEMLLQSHTGIVRVFPAIPDSWENVSFRGLRAMGAFLVSAEKKEGRVVNITIHAERGGRLRLASPFAEGEFTLSGTQAEVESSNGILEVQTRPGETLVIRPL